MLTAKTDSVWANDASASRLRKRNLYKYINHGNGYLMVYDLLSSILSTYIFHRSYSFSGGGPPRVARLSAHVLLSLVCRCQGFPRHQGQQPKPQHQLCLSSCFAVSPLSRRFEDSVTRATLIPASMDGLPMEVRDYGALSCGPVFTGDRLDTHTVTRNLCYTIIFGRENFYSITLG